MKFKFFILALFIFSLYSPVKATHIVGGEVTYTCLGNDEYEITLTLFRDCFYGNPNAWFDNPASIGVFNSDNILLQEILIPLMNNDTLVPTLSGECFVVPPDVCVHTTTYRATVNLPPTIGGYQLAYQRCCRNQTIANIIDPLGTGATYGVTISQQALLECNSSPQFQQWPPLYICVGEPIVFDQSATDVDGDSIVYRLCTPLKGANPDIPQPQPPNPPPYDPIDWVDPPYGVNNMLNGINGGIPLQINAQTGLLTGLPNTIGQFVVGICIEEYRNGTLISTTRRDFQYNVGVCGQWVASFFAPEIQCESFTVDFDNMSFGTGDFIWTFGDPSNPDFFSTEMSPSYTYPDTGRYLVTLIAGPDNPCVDTFQQEVYLQYNSLFPDFSFAFESCSDSLAIQITDLTVDTLFEVTEWLWELLPEDETSTLQHPILYASQFGGHVIRLTVTAENGCQEIIEQPVFIDLLNEELEADTLGICRGESAALNTGFNAEYSYQWSPETEFSDPTMPNPTVNPTDTTTYTVTITDADGFCQIERSITVAVPEALNIQMPADTVICDSDILLTAFSEGAVAYQWAVDANFTAVIADTSTVLVSPVGLFTYYVRVFDENNCASIDSVSVEGNAVDLVVSDSALICLGEQATIWANTVDLNEILTVEWQPESEIISPSDVMLIWVRPETAGGHTYYVFAENQFGCMAEDSVVVFAIDTISQESFVSSVQCSGYTVQFTSSSINAPFYTWHFGDPTAPEAMAFGQSVSHTYTEPGTYTVTINLPDDLACSETISRQITVGTPEIEVDFSWAYEACSDTAFVQFTDLSTNTQSMFFDWMWIFENGQVSDNQNPIVEFSESGEWLATLILSSSDGCVDSISMPVSIDLIEESLPDSVQICLRDSLQLNAGVIGEYEYLWSPSAGLSSTVIANPWASPSTTTTYTLTINSLDNICEIEREITVFVPPPIEYELSSDTSICEDNYLLFANSEQAEIYTWATQPDFSLPIGNEPEIVIYPGIESTFYIRLEDEFGCSVEDVVNVDGHAINVALNNEMILCIGDSIQLSVANLLTDELTFSWMPVEDIISGENSPFPFVSPEESTLYTVAIENEFGCSLDTFIQVNIFNYTPPLDITASPDTIAPGESSLLEATTANNYIYYWQPNNTLSNSGLPDPIATPLETTTYTLTIRDENGCINQALITVYVVALNCGEPHVFIPTGFTPDDDGLNDELEVYGNNIEEMHLIIYNRWGEMVFESKSQSEKWDGTYKGEKLTPDVFGFYLEVTCGGGEQYVKKGNITLLR